MNDKYSNELTPYEVLLITNLMKNMYPARGCNKSLLTQLLSAEEIRHCETQKAILKIFKNKY